MSITQLSCKGPGEPTARHHGPTVCHGPRPILTGQVYISQSEGPTLWQPRGQFLVTGGHGLNYDEFSSKTASL